MSAQIERRLVAERAQRERPRLALSVLGDRRVEAADRLAADVHLAADRILDGGVVGVQLDDVVGPALRGQLEVAVDGLRVVFGASTCAEGYTDAPSAAASSPAVVTGRSHTRPRHT